MNLKYYTVTVTGRKGEDMLETKGVFCELTRVAGTFASRTCASQFFQVPGESTRHCGQALYQKARSIVHQIRDTRAFRTGRRATTTRSVEEPDDSDSFEKR